MYVVPFGGRVAKRVLRLGLPYPLRYPVAYTTDIRGYPCAYATGINCLWAPHLFLSLSFGFEVGGVMIMKRGYTPNGGTNDTILSRCVSGLEHGFGVDLFPCYFQKDL